MIKKKKQHIFPVAPMGGNWIEQWKGTYRTKRGNRGQMSPAQMRREQRLPLAERIARIEGWINAHSFRDAEKPDMIICHPQDLELAKRIVEGA